MRSIVFRASVALVSTILVIGIAEAQETKGQQQCLNKSSGAARKVASSSLKSATDCLKKGSAGSLPMGTTAQACLTADLKGSIGKARTKTTGATGKYCGGINVPDFGYTDGATLNDSHQEEATNMVPDCFGTDLDAALAGPLAADTKAKCTSGAIGQVGKIGDALLKTYLACMKDGLKAGVVTDTATLQACLGDLNTDPRGRIGKAIGKLETKIESGCPATPGDFFPELDGVGELCDRYGIALPLNSATLATCLGNRMRCRVCRMLNESNDLNQNCDLLDDSIVDGTCPECPNGELDAGEECDDGNFTDGDGCTSLCIEEFCGDGITNDSGAEECDDGVSNSDTTPNACRTNCDLPTCGDGVTDDEFSEECDDGDTPTADCDGDCTFSTCGDGVINLLDGEICDDGNANPNDACVNCLPASCGDGFVHTGFEQCDGTECCTGLCIFALPGTACEGTEDICTSPQCNGSGTCLESPANEGQACDDDNICTVASKCTAGDCAPGPDDWVGTGLACQWVVVGSPTNNVVMVTNDNAVVSGGDWCALHAEFDVGSQIVGGDIITSDDDNAAVGRAILFGDLVKVDQGDVVTDGFKAETGASYKVPGLNVSLVAAGQHVLKNPSPTFYDTVGNDPRIDKCEAAQADLANVKADLNALTTTVNLGSTLQDLTTNPATIVAPNPGAVNVFNMTHLNGTTTNITVTISGGGNPNTIVVFRISQRLNTGANWTINLTNGLTADHMLFYVSKNGGDENCALGLFNNGGGTLFCPDVKVHVNGNTHWSGAAYGGASGLNGEVRIGDGVVFTYVPFTGDLP